jgi:uncharacterized protein YbjT (DUF2867 family)
MAGRIVLYGATGYIGGLTARAMLARGLRPVLAGRDRGRLDALAGTLSAAAGPPRRPSPAAAPGLELALGAGPHHRSQPPARSRTRLTNRADERAPSLSPWATARGSMGWLERMMLSGSTAALMRRRRW